MGVGTMPVDTAARAPHAHRTRGVAALGLLTAASLGLSVLGIGTGNGPLGPPGAYGYGISRDVGDSFTEGVSVLQNDGWFTVHIEGVRPLPTGEAATGMPITAIDLVPAKTPGNGDVDGSGFMTLAPGERSRPEGYRIPPERSGGERASAAELLVDGTLERPGEWIYHGYEVTYRSGWVRHRMVIDIDLVGCTPSGASCSQPNR